MAPSSDLEFRIGRARRLERALLNKGWTRTLLASKTGYDEKTIRNLLYGESVRDQTIIDVSQALEVDPELENDLGDVDVADDRYGGYLRHTHRYYESYFRLYRRAFGNRDDIFSTIVQIKWDDAEDRFHFLEYLKAGVADERRAHEGPVFMSSYTNLVHLLTIYEGSVRLATLTKLRESDGIMRGAMQTQRESLMFFQPVISPLILVKEQEYDFEAHIGGDIGLIERKSERYEFANQQLSLTEQEILRVSFQN